MSDRRSVLLPARSAPVSPASSPAAREDALLSVLGALGAVLGLIGWMDFGLNFVPPAVGNPDWEFGTVSVAVDSLPLATLGSGLFLAAAVQRGGRGLLRLLAVLMAGVALLLVAMTGLYLLSLPVIWKTVGAEMRGPLALAIGKTCGLSVLYLALYLWLGWVAGRRARALGASAGRA